ncbi:MAG: hypothetical protein Q9217_001710 [Psora testacea]
MPELRVGQLASPQERFCPYAAVNKYPYKHLQDEEKVVVSDNFFAHGAFRERGWSCYYIHTKLDSTQKPLILIPEVEVEEFFKEITMTLDIQATFPEVTKDPGFQLEFQEERSPRPRYLGRITKHCGVIELEEMIPAEGSAAEEPEELDDRSFATFKRKMEAAILSGKKQNKQALDKKRKERIEMKKGWCAELKRAQCYLGLSPRWTARNEDYLKDPNLSWDDSQHVREDYKKAAGISLPPLDPTAATPYPFDRNVVFVAVDIEAYERDQQMITEIGICTLDTSDIIKVAPGESGEEWMKYMRCRHFRIMERAHLINNKFIIGCADRFQQQFGTSEWISIKEAPQVIAACLKPPFSAPGQYTPHPASMHDVPRNGSRIQRLVKDDQAQKRNIILLGHDLRSDIDYLRKMGYDVGNLSNVIEAIDTVNLFRAYKHEHNPRNLGAVLLELGLAGWNLHNAGNDAAYTTQALIGIALAAREPRNKLPRRPSQTRLEDGANKTKAQDRGESEEWEVALEQGQDGGEAILLLPAAKTLDHLESERAMAKGRKADERNENKTARRETGFRGRGRLARASRARGGSGRGLSARNVSAWQLEPDMKSMPIDCEALDESMGVAGKSLDRLSGDLIEVAPIANNHNNHNSNSKADNGHKFSPSSQQATHSAKNDDYLPPHSRILLDAKAKESPVTSLETLNVEIPEISDRMATRLTLLDDDK